MITPVRGKYKVRVYVGIENGKRTHLYETAATLDDARRVERRLADEVAEGRNVSAARMTVDQLIDRWLTESGPDLSPKTLHEYRGMLRRHVSPAIGKTRIPKLTTARLDRFYNAELRDGKGLDPQTIEHVHAFIRKAFNVAIRKGYLSRNPATNATPPKVRRKQHQPPDPAVLKAFLDGLPLELGTYVRLVAVSGLRRGEACGLRWSDLEGDELTVQRALIDLGCAIEKGTKTDRIRAVGLDPVTLSRLVVEHRAAEEAKAERCDMRFSKDAPIFTTDPGVPWRPDLASHRVRRAANRFGTKITIQDLRRWMITYGLHGGHSVRQMADRAGHADGSLVLSRYGHAVPAADAAVASSLGALLD